MPSELIGRKIWFEPTLEPNLLYLEDPRQHYENASQYMLWVLRNYHAGNKDMGTPKDPIRLPPDGRDGPDWEQDRIRERGRYRVRSPKA